MNLILDNRCIFENYNIYLIKIDLLITVINFTLKIAQIILKCASNDLSLHKFINFCAMEKIPSFNSFIEKSIIDNWDLDALTDYQGVTLQYKDVARKIEKLHIMFENSGVVKGDKIAICGRNSANWAVAFIATLTYGAVAVPVLHEFTPEQVYNIVNHSEAKLLFVGDVVATTIDATKIAKS